MKRIFIGSVIIFLTNICLGQSSFSECYDTLSWKLTHASTYNPDRFIDWENCIKGKAMPDLLLKTITGEMIDTKDLKGKVVFINLWYTACAPCMAEVPALNLLAREYNNKNVAFIGITTDTKQTLDSDFFPKHKLDFVIIPDALSTIEGIGVTGFPTTYIVDKNGNVVDAWVGGYTNEKAQTAAYLRAKPIIDKLLVN
jgi:peroxiredoxin